MTTINHELTVNYSAAEMFALVTNVNAYSSFIPNCINSQMMGRNDKAFRFRLTLAKGPMKKAFIIDYYPHGENSIDLRLMDKLFKQAKGLWQFEPLAQGSKFMFHLEYEFSNPITAMAYGSVFEKIANNLAYTFRERAEVVYGKIA